MSEKYNGWSTRETWLCSLWLTNDQNIYNLINDTFKHLKHSYQARDFINDLLFGMNPIAENGLMLDLLNSAIANVNIFEIVEFFRDSDSYDSKLRDIVYFYGQWKSLIVVLTQDKRDEREKVRDSEISDMRKEIEQLKTESFKQDTTDQQLLKLIKSTDFSDIRELLLEKLK